MEPWRRPTRLVGKLSPGDRQTLEFTVLPKNTRDPYINVVVVVSYRDRSTAHDNRFELQVLLEKGKTEPGKSSNPYIPGKPIDPLVSGDMFYGRRELIQFIADNLVGKSQANILLLHGQRRIGKTSLLLQFCNTLLKPPFHPVFLDIQGLANDAGTYLFLYRLTREISKTFANFGVQIECPSRKTSLEGGYEGFEAFLDCVSAELHGGYLVLMLDEFEELQDIVSNRKIDSNIFAFIRSQMQHRRQVVFLFAGTHRLQELSKEYFNIFFNTAIFCEISYLTENEAEQLIRQPVAATLTYHDRAVKRIKDATALNPYFIQLICHDLVDRVLRDGQTQISLQQVNAVIDKLIDGEIIHLEYLWGQSSAREKVVLCGIAELQRTMPSARHFPDIEIQRKIESAGERLTPNEFDRAMELLIARDLVQHPENLHSYGIRFELLSRWIRKKHPRISK